ncbi:transposase [Pseudomonas sp. MPB26]|uniref:transposase n=1 Tax=Pseudomonas sp. MPB26 TaxID=3388491 RepID=UPI00398495A0
MGVTPAKDYKHPGIGPLIASALVADVGTLRCINRPEIFGVLRVGAAAILDWRANHSPGYQQAWDRYLRTLLMQGAQTLLYRIDKRNDALGVWARSLLARKPLNKVACALANKMARIVWALLTKGGTYNGHATA